MSEYNNFQLSGSRKWPFAASTVGRLGGAAVVFALAVSFPGCTTVAPERDLLPVRTDAAEGAVAPAGLADIRAGMSQREVLRILSPFHVVKHAADASPDMPIMDYFVYIEDGQSKWAEIFYDSDRVVDARYGYVEPFVLIS